MLKVELKRRSVYIDLEADTFPNKGGYFCRVYADNSTDFELDSFTISSKDLAWDKNKLDKAKKIAAIKVKYLFS